MKPDVPKVMMRSFERMLTHIAPHLNAEYAVGSASVIGLMMFQTATEFDRAAENLVQENRAMRSLFADAVSQLETGALSAKLKEAAAGDDPSVRVSELEKTNEALSALLIELHALVETLPEKAAREMEARIWAELVRSAEARRLPHPMVG